MERITVLIIILIVAVSALAGFAFKSAKNANPEKNSNIIDAGKFSLKAGEEKITSQGIGIKFEELSMDGRCPLGTECFKPGSAEIKVSIAYLGKKASKNLIIKGLMRKFAPADELNTIITEDGKWQIVFYKLDPYPVYQKPAGNSQKTAYFEITQK